MIHLHWRARAQNAVKLLERFFSYQLFWKQRQHLGQMYPVGESMEAVESQAFTGAICSGTPTILQWLSVGILKLILK